MAERRRRPRWSSMGLLDGLVRPQQNRLRDREAERLGDLEVDHQLEPGRLFDREIGGLRAFTTLTLRVEPMRRRISR